MRLLFLLLLASGASAQSIEVFPEFAGEPGRTCATHSGTRVCRTESQGEASLTVARGGRDVARWPVARGPQASEVAAFATDLDRDGGRDLIVATQTAVSNGMSVVYWTVDVVPEGASEPAYSFQAEDFSARGRSFGHHRGRLVIWATDWISGPDPRGQRPEGMYLTGRPFHLASGGLAPARVLPIRARRLLFSFSRDAAEGPLGWLSDRRAESLRTDMALADCRQRSEPVTVRSVRTGTDDWDEVQTTLTLADGRELGYGSGLASDGALSHLGDAASGRLFPPEYRPVGVAGRLTGEHRLTTCASGDWVRARVLWL